MLFHGISPDPRCPAPGAKSRLINGLSQIGSDCAKSFSPPDWVGLEIRVLAGLEWSRREGVLPGPDWLLATGYRLPITGGAAAQQVISRRAFSTSRTVESLPVMRLASFQASDIFVRAVTYVPANSRATFSQVTRTTRAFFSTISLQPTRGGSPPPSGQQSRV